MPGELFEIDGERKKRVVCPNLDFSRASSHCLLRTVLFLRL